MGVSASEVLGKGVSRLSEAVDHSRRHSDRRVVVVLHSPHHPTAAMTRALLGAVDPRGSLLSAGAAFDVFAMDADTPGGWEAMRQGSVEGLPSVWFFHDGATVLRVDGPDAIARWDEIAARVVGLTDGPVRRAAMVSAERRMRDAEREDAERMLEEARRVDAMMHSIAEEEARRRREEAQRAEEMRRANEMKMEEEKRLDAARKVEERSRLISIKERLREQLPEEPPMTASAAEVATIRLLSPLGTPHERRWWRHQTVKQLMTYAAVIDEYDGSSFMLRTKMPSTVLLNPTATIGETPALIPTSVVVMRLCESGEGVVRFADLYN